jgi:hypothetical protein
MASRKRPQSRQNEYQSGDFEPPYGDNKKGRGNMKTVYRSHSPSSSGSTSSSCIDDTVGHMNAVRGDLLVGRCKLPCWDTFITNKQLYKPSKTKDLNNSINEKHKHQEQLYDCEIIISNYINTNKINT